MTLRRTEQTAKPEDCIDQLAIPDAARRMVSLQRDAVEAVQSVRPAIESAASLVTQALKQGHRVHYVAAGSSGLMALADGSELPGTFGIAPEQIRIHMAGGVPMDAIMPGDTEDDTSDTDAIVAGLNAGDIVIAISASGRTPYTCAIAKGARTKGITVISVANTENSLLLQAADVAIYLPTPPEALAGSTRLGAATAQKVALNMISTLAGVQMGHVYNGMMVNLRADNIKLRDRAIRIVCAISGVRESQAIEALRAADHETKLAVLLTTGCDAEIAKRLLMQHEGHLGPCLADLKKKQT